MCCCITMPCATNECLKMWRGKLHGQAGAGWIPAVLSGIHHTSHTHHTHTGDNYIKIYICGSGRLKKVQSGNSTKARLKKEMFTDTKWDMSGALLLCTFPPTLPSVKIHWAHFNVNYWKAWRIMTIQTQLLFYKCISPIILLQTKNYINNIVNT